MFYFNDDFSDLAQVAQFLPAFEARLRELEAAGQYRYNDSFKGCIPGIQNTEQRGPNVGTHEEAAIYLLQGLERKCRQDELVWDLLARGYKFIKRLPANTKFEEVVLVPTGRMDGEFARFPGGKVVITEKPGQIHATGQLYGVIPKGKRTIGFVINGRRVLVK